MKKRLLVLLTILLAATTACALFACRSNPNKGQGSGNGGGDDNGNETKHEHTLTRFSAVEPECESDGNIEYWYCSVCNKYYSDANGTKEIDYEDLVIPMLGHDIVSHSAQSPSCTGVGWYVYDTCTRCDYTTYREIPATGHSYADVWSSDENVHWHASTCGHDFVSDTAVHVVENGVCKVCGKTFDYTYGLEYELLEDNTYAVVGLGTSTATVITVPSTHDGLPVTAVADEAFANTAITNVKLSSGMRTVGERAFYGCASLVLVNFPESCTSVGADAFSGCEKLETATLSASMTAIEDNLFYGCVKLTTIHISPSLVSIGDSAFYGCASLKDFSIPSTVTSIGNYAFYNCGLTSATVPEGISALGDYMFYGCGSLSSVTLPSRLTSIGEYTFGECVFSAISLPTAITAIGSYAFRSCTLLTSITLPAGVTVVENGVFFNCSRLAEVKLLGEVTSIGSNAFGNCTALRTIVLPDTVKQIGDSAFTNDSGLTSLNMPANLETLGESAFSYCTSLGAIILPEGLTMIGNSAFYASGIESVRIPASVSIIGSAAFYNCNSLKTIEVATGNEYYSGAGNCLIEIAAKKLIFGFDGSVIPSDGSVTCIAYMSYIGMSVVIPKSVTEIEGAAFTSSIQTVFYEGTKDEWDNVNIGAANDKFLQAARYYYSDTQPTDGGNYWHYVGGEPVIWTRES